jgi:acetyl-CoA acetyltransferase
VSSSRNPIKDHVAFAGASTTGFTRDAGPTTPGSLAARACLEVLRDTGLAASDVDGICGSGVAAAWMQTALGIPEITWFANPAIPFVNQVIAAASAVYSGDCDVVLAYHSVYRGPSNSRSATHDPFRVIGGFGAKRAPEPPESIFGAPGYAAWASRYLYEYPQNSREHFGYIAINDRSNAARNPGAVMREPMTLDDYLSARMIRWPLCVLDMDVPIDGADAFIITTKERARDLPHSPVLINAVTLGQIDKNDEDQQPDLRHHGQHVVVEALKAKSDFWISDIDVYFPYDGFTIITLAWIENSGWCGPGEAGAWIKENWDPAGNRLLANGRIPVNPHGGALSEGGTQGSGHVREAVLQLQGRAGERQVHGASRALVTTGGFFTNAQGMTLRIDG